MEYEVYDQQGNLLEEYDLNLGRLEYATRTEHHDAIEGVEEVYHYEVIAEYPNGGKDIEKVIDVIGIEAQPEWDEEIPIYIYIPYTPEELEEIEKERNKPTLEEEIEMLKSQLASYEAAYAQGVNEAWV